MRTSDDIRTLLRRARRLAGTVQGMPEHEHREPVAGSFRRLVITAEPRVTPADNTELAAYCAAELGTLVAAPSRRAGRVPTVVPADVLRLAATEGVRSEGVSDAAVLDGTFPVTWLSAYRLLPRSGWIKGLVELERDALEALAGPHARVEIEIDPEEADSEVLRAKVVAVAADDVTALARGLVTTSVRADGFRLDRTPVHWVTAEVSWDDELAAEWPDLPAPRGRVRIQAVGSGCLGGLIRELATPHLRIAAWRARHP